MICRVTLVIHFHFLLDGNISLMEEERQGCSGCWSVGLSVVQYVGWSVGWSVGQSDTRSVGWYVSLSVSWFVSRSVSGSVGWSVGQFVDWSVGQSVGRSVGQSSKNYQKNDKTLQNLPNHQRGIVMTEDNL